MAVTPRLADVQCTRLQFKPGDKVLVKWKGPERLDRESRRKIQKMVEKWTGDHVEVLIVDTTIMEVSKLGYEEHQGIIRTIMEVSKLGYEEHQGIIRPGQT